MFLIVPPELISINDILLFTFFEHSFSNSHAGGISGELPNLTHQCVAFLSRTERTTTLSSMTRRLLYNQTYL